MICNLLKRTKMKKIAIYLYSFLTVVAFTACNENFDDWASPQSNPQEDAKSLSLEVATMSASLDLSTIKTDSMGVAKMVSVSQVEGGTVIYEVLLGQNVGSLTSLPFTEVGGVLKVATLELEDAVWAMYGKAGAEHPVKLQVKASIVTAAGQASSVTGNVLDVTVKTKTLPIEEGYYLVGDVNGWNQNAPLKLDAKGNGIFELVVMVDKDASNVKIIPQSGVVEGGDFWGSAMGTAKNEDNSPTGSIAFNRNGVEPGAIQIAKAGEVKVTINMNDYSYTIIPVTKEMFMIGSPWSWNWSNVEASMVAIHSADGGFWSMNYFNAGDEIKFAPEKGWGKDFGYDASNLSAATIELAGLTNSGNNIGIGKSGWYIVKIITATDGARTVEFLTPNVYLMGETSDGGWDSQLGVEDKFSVPATATGEFISPALAQSGNVRICVNIGADWWKTEFNVIDGAIAFRGNGGDQPAVQGTAGQKVSLNFSNNTGKIQ